MFKHKVVFPTQARLQSPYQLEDCKRRLGYLKQDMQPIMFTQLDTDRIHFRIRRVKTQRIPSPMIAFEISGTLRRWGGTGTVVDGYQLKRLRAQTDTWVMILIVLSVVAALVLMFPAMVTMTGSVQLLSILLVAFGVAGLPLLTWTRHTLALDIDHDIDVVHQSIMQALDME